MDTDQFKLVISQLRDGQTQEIDCIVDPKFLDVNDPELQFQDPVQVNGEAYVAGDELILHLTVATQAWIPCSICNEPVSLAISSGTFYHSVPLGEIKNNLFDYTETVRENLLLEVPRYVECGGECPARKIMGHYLKTSGPEEEEGQMPFKDL